MSNARIRPMGRSYLSSILFPPYLASNSVPMRLAVLTALFGITAALPQAPAMSTSPGGNLFDVIANLLLKLDLTDNDTHDLTNGTCRDAYFLMARGSGEWGTLVGSRPVHKINRMLS
jgi:hypothetical protein